MKVKIGEKIGCDFGEGFLIAATKTWAIVDIDDEEYAVPRDETWVVECRRAAHEGGKS
jgi:hypothetical protein